MLKHIVIYKLNDTSPEMLNKIRDTFYSMKGKIDCLVDIKCGWDLLHSGRSFDFCLECTFESMEKMQEYQVNPVHLPVKAFVGTVATQSACVDFLY
ncbi:MAG: Dabb family protein [Clostridia bacterium]